MTLAPTSHQAHDVRGEDLPTLAGGTEPGGFDHRFTEVVVLVSIDLAPAQPDADPHSVLTPSVVSFDALLHGHGARQRP